MSPEARRKLKERLYNEQGGICPYCLGEMTLTQHFNNSATVDHLIPKSRGGADLRENFVIACKSCNEDKGNKMPNMYILAMHKRHNPNRENTL